jgi:hypothetical protein
VKIIASILFVCLAGCGTNSGEKSKVSLSDQYPGSWTSDFNMEITKALSKNGVGGCGEYEFKVSPNSSSEYLVRCTRDGKTWTLYQVLTTSGSVSGPFPFL